MEKEFRTIDGLVALLESRGVTTDHSTAAYIKRDGYYAVVNGYKGPFLDRQAMQASPSDVYKEGTSFAQIYDLFRFDRDMRGVLLPFLIDAESISRNAVVYAFCDHHREPDAYLERSNYATARNMLVPEGFKGNRYKEREKRLNTLIGIFSRKLTLNDRTRPFIRHYIEKYGRVPLWVLQNDLTFGNIEHFYQLQQRGVQNETCRIVTEVAGHDTRLGARTLLRVLTVLVGYRNICAHDDRLYCATVKGSGVREMLLYLETVLPTKDIDALSDSIQKVQNTYMGRVPSAILELGIT